MPDGKPTKAPLIVFGTMATMSFISIGVVFYTHSRRTEPYLDTKMRRVKTIEKMPEEAEPARTAPEPSVQQDFDGGTDRGSAESARP